MNYSEIVAAAKAYADRSDTDVNDNIDVFIILTEARINRLLRTRKQSKRTTTPTVADAEYYSLPSDYRAMRDIQLNSEPNTGAHSVQQFHLISPEQMNIQRGLPYAGKLYYLEIANQIQIYPCQDAGKEIELVYYQKVPNLTSINNTNWLSTDHPDIYLSGLCAEISLFAKHYDAADGWFDRLGSAIKDLDNSDAEDRWSGAAIVTRVG